MNNVFDETEGEKEQREDNSFWDFTKGIIVFVVVILFICGILLALALPKSNAIPTNNELQYEWLEENQFQWEP